MEFSVASHLSISAYFVFFASHGIDGRIYNEVIRVWYTHQPSVHQQLMEGGFGFLEGGEVHFTMDCPVPRNQPPSPHLWMLFCSVSEAREYTRMTKNQLDFDCARLSSFSSNTLGNSLQSDHKVTIADVPCMRQRVYHNASQQNGHYSFYQKMPDQYFFSLILLQCMLSKEQDNSSVEVRLDFTPIVDCQSSLILQNPGGVHLGSDEIPMPLIYTAINLIWALLTAAWFFNWVIYFKYSNRLHRFISCAPICKVVLVILILVWWQEISNTGKESKDVQTLREFVQSIEDALLFMTQMIIAEGWGVVRSQIKHYRWSSLLLLFGVFAISLMCVHWVNKYFLAFSVCCVVFMMFKTLKWSSHNIELLRRRRRKIRRFITRHNLRYKGSITVDSQLCQKLNIYHHFRIVCASFSVAYAVTRILATFLQEYSYIRALTFEIPELMVYMAIGFLFRLRNFEPYEHIELVPPRENVIVFELPDVCIQQINPHVTLGVPLHTKVEKETQTPRRRWRDSVW